MASVVVADDANPFNPVVDVDSKKPVSHRSRNPGLAESRLAQSRLLLAHDLDGRLQMAPPVLFQLTRPFAIYHVKISFTGLFDSRYLRAVHLCSAHSMPENIISDLLDDWAISPATSSCSVALRVLS